MNRCSMSSAQRGTRRAMDSQRNQLWELPSVQGRECCLMRLGQNGKILSGKRQQGRTMDQEYRDSPRNCPSCRLVNPPDAQVCDCGYDFQSGLQGAAPTRKRKSSHKGPPSGILILVLVLMGGRMAFRATNHAAQPSTERRSSAHQLEQARATLRALERAETQRTQLLAGDVLRLSESSLRPRGSDEIGVWDRLKVSALSAARGGAVALTALLGGRLKR